MSEEPEDYSPDTRQSHTHTPELADPPDPVEDQTTVEESVDELQDLYVQRNSLEAYHRMITEAGNDGLDHVANQIMRVNLQQLKLRRNSVGMESFDATVEYISVEGISEWLKDVGARIKQLIDKLITLAKEYATRIMSGIEGVKSQAEELTERARKGGRKPSNELHDTDKEITIGDPAILWANDSFCLSECKPEQEVVKFFTSIWPKYAKDQITRAKKMMADYDVANGNLEQFESNLEFLGNHQSLVHNVTRYVLPGNKQIGFKFVALGPELIDAEDASPAPGSYTLKVRTPAEINGTLRTNVATMNALGSMFRGESEVLHEMASLSEALMSLEDRRAEAFWKSAKEDLDEISKAIMELITRLKPNYDPIARHLAKVGTARNLVCRKELDALGQ